MRAKNLIVPIIFISVFFVLSLVEAISRTIRLPMTEIILFMFVIYFASYFEVASQIRSIKLYDLLSK